MSRGKAMSGHQRPYRGASDDWITPPEIIEALGPFDLDPCVCTPQPFRTAAKSIDRARDGLSRRWSGRVWLNPPYGPDAAAWLERLADHGRGTALIFARTETAAFHAHVWGRASGLLFLAGRLHFYRPDGTRAKHNSGAPSVLVAYGKRDAGRLHACNLNGAFVNLRA